MTPLRIYFKTSNKNNLNNQIYYLMRHVICHVIYHMIYHIICHNMMFHMIKHVINHMTNHMINHMINYMINNVINHMIFSVGYTLERGCAWLCPQAQGHDHRINPKLQREHQLTRERECFHFQTHRWRSQCMRIGFLIASIRQRAMEQTSITLVEEEGTQTRNSMRVAYLKEASGGSGIFIASTYSTLRYV